MVVPPFTALLWCSNSRMGCLIKFKGYLGPFVWLAILLELTLKVFKNYTLSIKLITHLDSLSKVLAVVGFVLILSTWPCNFLRSFGSSAKKSVPKHHEATMYILNISYNVGYLIPIIRDHFECDPF